MDFKRRRELSRDASLRRFLISLVRPLAQSLARTDAQHDALERYYDQMYDAALGDDR